MTDSLLNLLAQATVISSGGIALTLLLRKRFRRIFGPGLAYFLWLLVPTSLFVLLLPAPGAGLKAVLAVPLWIPSLTYHVSTSHAVAASVHSSSDWKMWLLCAWGGGVLSFCWRLLRQQQRFMAGLGDLSAVEDGVFRGSDPATGPVVMGLLRPRIVVPGDFNTRYAPEEQALILAHERMHIRRGDLLTNATCALARCIFWFNPLAHVAARLVRFDQELACDAAVMRRYPRSRKPYANAMLRTQLVEGALPLGCYWPATHPLKERIMVLKQPPARGPRRVLGQMLIGTCVFLVGYASWAMQPDSLPGDEARLSLADPEVRLSSDSVEHDGDGVSYKGHVTLAVVGTEDNSTQHQELSFSADSEESSAAKQTTRFTGHVIMQFALHGVPIRTTSDKAWLFGDSTNEPPAGGAPAGHPARMLLAGNVQIEVHGHIFNTARAQIVGDIFQMEEVEVAP